MNVCQAIIYLPCEPSSALLQEKEGKWKKTDKKLTNSTQVQRVLCAIPSAKLPLCFDALYKEFWVEGNSKINQPETFLPLLESAADKEVAANALAQVCKTKKEREEKTAVIPG